MKNQTLRIFLLVATFYAIPALADAPVPGSPLWFCKSLEQSQLSNHFEKCKAPDWAKPDGQKAVTTADAAAQQCLDMIMSGEAEKRLKFNRKSAKACIQAYDTYTKKLTAPLLAKARSDCAAAITGSKKLDESCSTALDCTKGLVCAGPRLGPPGKCTKPRPVEAACDDDVPNDSVLFWLLGADLTICGPGNECILETDALVCKKRRKTASQEATRVHCSSFRECASGEACSDGKCTILCGK